MPRYLYNALKENKKDVVEGEIEAVTPREAREKIRELGYMPLKIFDPALVVNEMSDFSDNQGGITFLSLNDKIMFVSEVQVMLSSGISIVDALNTIYVNSPRMKVKKIAKELQVAILGGKTFAEAVNYLYHDAFGDTFIDLCVTGENSGELDKTLDRMLVMLRQQDEIKGNIIQALIYPCIVILIMCGLLILFSKFVFPTFASAIMMSGAGVDIPVFAATVMGTLQFIGDYWWLCILSIFAFFGAVNFLATYDKTRAFFDKLFLQIPIIKDFVNYINLANYMCILNISYATGVPFMKSLELARRTIGNTEIKQKADYANRLVEKGATLSDAFHKASLLPGALVTMIAAGEKAGNLSKMLQDCVDVIDKKIDMVLKALTKAFEPTLIVVLGAIVFVIAIAFFQLYIGLIQSLV